MFATRSGRNRARQRRGIVSGPRGRCPVVGYPEVRSERWHHLPIGSPTGHQPADRPEDLLRFSCRWDGAEDP